MEEQGLLSKFFVDGCVVIENAVETSVCNGALRSINKGLEENVEGKRDKRIWTSTDIISLFNTSEKVCVFFIFFFSFSFSKRLEMQLD